MLPEPCGGGSLLPASPIFRTHDTWCSAVHPRGAALGLAPRSRRYAASSKWALPAASRNASRFASRCSRATPPAVSAELTASDSSSRDPESSSVPTASLCPSRAANSSGVKPFLERASTSAPAATSARIDVVVAFGGGPHQRRLLRARLSRAFDLRAARASSASTASTLPDRAAGISTVSPSDCCVFGSAPASSSNATIAAWPPVRGQRRAAARRSGSPRPRCAPARTSSVGHLDVVPIGRPVQRGRAVSLQRIARSGAALRVRAAHGPRRRHAARASIESRSRRRPQSTPERAASTRTTSSRCARSAERDAGV